jgi:SAM-dependent methyltransferase
MTPNSSSSGRDSALRAELRRSTSREALQSAVELYPMATAETSSAPTFKQHELAGWDAKAKRYDDYAGKITLQAVQPLLAAAGIEAGTRLLDVASGPGYVAGAAAARGAMALGVDFAPSMVIEATKNFPCAEFRQGDAEALQFENNTFDVVICAFGLIHMAEPDRAITESFRVLRPGGRFAFTAWCSPEKHAFFGLVMGAIRSHGTFDVLLPPAPPPFRFSDHIECKSALSAAGFIEVEVSELPLIWEPRSPRELLDLIYKSGVRTAMLLELQEAGALERIHRAILDGALQFKHGETFQVAFPAVMAVARKPL